MNATKEVFCHAISNRNIILANYLNQQSNELTHCGSTPNHVMINREQETLDYNLFIDYFTKNSCYGDDMFH